MKCKKALTSVTFFIVLMTMFAQSEAQVVAKGGEIVEMHSPMVVDIPLKEITLGRVYWRFPDLHKYICDGVEITSLGMTIEEMPASGSSKLGKLNFAGILFVHPSRDRKVDLLIDLLFGKEVIATAFKNRIDAEEDEHKGFNIKMQIKAETFQQLVSDRNKASLRITMTLR